jgi:hypothetical protein
VIHGHSRGIRQWTSPAQPQLRRSQPLPLQARDRLKGPDLRHVVRNERHHPGPASFTAAVWDPASGRRLRLRSAYPTPHPRPNARAVLAMLDGVPVTEVASQFGGAGSRCTGGWSEIQAEGMAGLEDRLHRPASCPHQINAVVDAQLLRWRPRHPGWRPRRPPRLNVTHAWKQPWKHHARQTSSCGQQHAEPCRGDCVRPARLSDAWTPPELRARLRSTAGVAVAEPSRNFSRSERPARRMPGLAGHQGSA